MNIILIGMPGCGKSTVGVVLAKTMGYAFCDADLVIQHREQMLLQDIIDQKGTDYFMRAEENALLSIECDRTVIATGGSAVYSDAGMRHLKKNGVAVHIFLACDELEPRLSNLMTRGVVGSKTESVRQLFDERAPLYEKYADITADCGGLTVEQSMELIKMKLHEYTASAAK